VCGAAGGRVYLTRSDVTVRDGLAESSEGSLAMSMSLVGRVGEGLQEDGGAGPRVFLGGTSLLICIERMKVLFEKERKKEEKGTEKEFDVCVVDSFKPAKRSGLYFVRSMSPLSSPTSDQITGRGLRVWVQVMDNGWDGPFLPLRTFAFILSYDDRATRKRTPN
jgi:hypothetical protein